jgi:hypothetical protein
VRFLGERGRLASSLCLACHVSLTPAPAPAHIWTCRRAEGCGPPAAVASAGLLRGPALDEPPRSHRLAATARYCTGSGERKPAPRCPPPNRYDEDFIAAVKAMDRRETDRAWWVRKGAAHAWLMPAMRDSRARVRGTRANVCRLGRGRTNASLSQITARDKLIPPEPCHRSNPPQLPMGTPTSPSYSPLQTSQPPTHQPTTNSPTNNSPEGTRPLPNTGLSGLPRLRGSGTSWGRRGTRWEVSPALPSPAP